MIQALPEARKLWATPEELVTYWEGSEEKIEQEKLVKNFIAHSFSTFPKTVVDLGCGVGRYAKVLPYEMYYGYDSSTAMILQACSDNKENRKTQFACIDIFNFQPDMTFDYLIMIDVAHHQDEPVDALFRVMDNWKAKRYFFSIVVGGVREDLFNSTVVAFPDLLRLYDIHNVTRTYIQRFDDNQFAWMLLEVKK